jgi:hypothetical protein
MKKNKLLTIIRLMLNAAGALGLLIIEDEKAASSKPQPSAAALWSNYYSIPFDLLNPADLQLLGLPATTQFVKLGSGSELREAFGSGLDLISSRGLYVPRENTSLLFLFNKTIADNRPHHFGINDASTSGKETSAMQIIQASLPLGLPNYHYVSQYSLLAPRTIVDNLAHKQLSTVATVGKPLDKNPRPVLPAIVPFKSANHWIRESGLKKMAIPLSSSMIKKSDFILTFIFNGADDLADLYQQPPDLTGNDKDDAVRTLQAFNSLGVELQQEKVNIYREAQRFIDEALLLSRSEVAKAVLSSSSRFFDEFAKRWVANMGFDTLLYSTFCQVNALYFEQSYCLKFEKGTPASNNNNQDGASSGGATAMVSLLALDKELPYKLQPRLCQEGLIKKRRLESSVLEKYELLETKTDMAIENIRVFMDSVQRYAKQTKKKNCKNFFITRNIF